MSRCVAINRKTQSKTSEPHLYTRLLSSVISLELAPLVADVRINAFTVKDYADHVPRHVNLMLRLACEPHVMGKVFPVSLMLLLAV